MTQTFTIPGKLPSYNDLQGNWRTVARVKGEAMTTIGWAAKVAHIAPVSGKARVTIRCYEPNRKRDPSNVRSGAEKVIYDALQNIGIIKNDNWARLVDCPATVEYDKENPRVEVIIDDG